MLAAHPRLLLFEFQSWNAGLLLIDWRGNTFSCGQGRPDWKSMYSRLDE